MKSITKSGLWALMLVLLGGADPTWSQTPAPTRSPLPIRSPALSPSPLTGKPSPKPKPTPFPRLSTQPSPSPSPAGLPGFSTGIEALPLFPDPGLATALDNAFRLKLAAINSQITDKQVTLQTLLSNWAVSDEQIRAIQAELSTLRTERDRLALEHILMIRQLRDNLTIPNIKP